GLVHVLAEFWAVLESLEFVVSRIWSPILGQGHFIGALWISCWIWLGNEEFHSIVWNVWVGAIGSNVILGRPREAHLLSWMVFGHGPLWGVRCLIGICEGVSANSS